MTTQSCDAVGAGQPAAAGAQGPGWVGPPPLAEPCWRWGGGRTGRRGPVRWVQGTRSGEDWAFLLTGILAQA